ncbi:ABC transporter permease subunit [Polaromonas sp. YR568]|jgi:NitT/TauT family transport system permease protein|uniref:ABC transporter permease n=1 Tax=Polaromonas sp. YR568 TaxID=1855301 RepID=UPI00313839AF
MLIKGYRIPLFTSLILWAILWEIVGHTGLGLILPPLTKIFTRMVEIVPTKSFLDALYITGKSFFLGNLIAIAIGIPMGVLMGRVKTADALILPWVNLFLSAPLSALVPVIMVLAGIGEVTIVLTVVLFAIWIIVLNARAGVLNIPPSLVEMSRSFGATRYQSFVNIYVWAALPEILAGIRLGMIRAVKGVVIGQLLISVVGFGTLFELYAAHFLMEHFWALILVIFAFAFSINEALAWTERRFKYFASSR